METSGYVPEYIIVGSGAGGGPLAANLARRGHKVLLIEAGDDICSKQVGGLLYDVPVFHALCTEAPECAWNYFVHHYADLKHERKDTKFDESGNGVWYPRASTLGGCTAHNAMITVTPQAIDWDSIASTTGDWSWHSGEMLKYFQRLENCNYVSRPGTLSYVLKGVLWSAIARLRRSPNWKDWSHGHGFDGWLSTEEANPRLVLNDRALLRIVFNTIRWIIRLRIGSLLERALTRFDPNDIRNAHDSPEGIAFTPLATKNGRRNGPREYILETQKAFPDNLRIERNVLVTKIIFEAKRAVGVAGLLGKGVYRASPCHDIKSEPTVCHWIASREIILAAGAFNSPQLLLLSGIGPEEELKKLGIDVISNVPGVGKNLQDRYEVSVVSKLSAPFTILQDATFKLPPNEHTSDALLKMWKKGKGLYCSNGSVIRILKRSSPALPESDLYIFGIPGLFKGYQRGYASALARFKDMFSWVILKAYTNNRAGEVTLQSSDPRDPPRIDFHYFAEGTDKTNGDLDAVAAGVEFVRKVNRTLGKRIAVEEVPGRSCTSAHDLRDFVQNEAWGHHASCTNKIGHKSDRMAVLDSRFRVRGVEGLRVVDASVFPKIPGYFIVAAVYMISEKAADVIHEDAKQCSTVL